MTHACVVAALTLLVVAIDPAGAQDACLTGESLLGDQRAMAGFRTDLESVCPCATATSRGAYKRCARTLVASTVTAGDLRQECERTARRVIRDASCGTLRVPCGKVRPDGSVAISCKVKRAATCVDRAAFDQTACADQQFCNDVVDWTAGTCSDVRVRGPFEAGVRVMTFTKDSVVDPGTDRVLDTAVWYPTTPGAGPIDGFFGAVVDAPIDGSGGPYPVLMFSHGSCGYTAQSTFLTALLASRGYIVVAPPHPGNTLFDGIPACSTPQALIASAAERPTDVTFALDQMLAENANPTSDFYGLLDPTRIGMSGHSFGGLTTYIVAQQDARFGMALPMAPAAQFNQNGVTIPSLLMLSELDSYVDNDANRVAYANSSAPKYLVEIQNTGHFAYSNGCFASPDCNPPTTLTQDEAHAAVLRWVVPFVEWRLGGDQRFAPFFGAPTPPGAVVEAAP